MATLLKDGIRPFLRRAWIEYPEVVGSHAIGIVGLVLAGFGIYDYKVNDGDNRRYKVRYVVMRPEDPRVAKIRKD